MTLSYVWSKLMKKLRGAAIKDSRIHRTSKVEPGTLFVNSTMKRHSFCGYDCQIINCDIGSFCSIAGGVVIGGGMHPMSWVSMSPVFYAGRDSVKEKFSEHKREETIRVEIGHDVWIGENVLVKQGVKIGTGAVIGMGSVVTRDVPPYKIYAGNPAKEIRSRFDEVLSSRLLKSRWWELPESKLKNLGKYSNDPKAFLNAMGE